jgi:phage terminase large subunit-like protein
MAKSIFGLPVLFCQLIGNGFNAKYFLIKALMGHLAGVEALLNKSAKAKRKSHGRSPE